MPCFRNHADAGLDEECHPALMSVDMGRVRGEHDGEDLARGVFGHLAGGGFTEGASSLAIPLWTGPPRAGAPSRALTP